MVLSFNGDVEGPRAHCLSMSAEETEALKEQVLPIHSLTKITTLGVRSSASLRKGKIGPREIAWR